MYGRHLERVRGCTCTCKGKPLRRAVPSRATSKIYLLRKRETVKYVPFLSAVMPFLTVKPPRFYTSPRPRPAENRLKSARYQ